MSSTTHTYTDAVEISVRGVASTLKLIIKFMLLTQMSFYNTILISHALLFHLFMPIRQPLTQRMIWFPASYCIYYLLFTLLAICNVFLTM